MKKLLTLLLLFSISTSSAGIFNKKRTAKEKEAAAKTAPTPAPAQEHTTPKPAPASKPTAAPKAKEPVYYKVKPAVNLKPSQIDSLVAVWREQQTLASFENFFDEYVNIDPTTVGQTSVPDSVYQQRLRDLVSPIQLPYNSIVKGYINRYTDTRYGTINRILSLSQYYFPMIEEELIKAGLPVELRALPIIESALCPTAVSPMGATGLWQFMPATGKVYGLEVNSLIDERRDPLLATRAACRYLKDMYDIFKDWSLAIAAYNCGPGNVTKAIARAGGNVRSFWDIYDYLPRETRGYVPAFIGASYAYAYHRQHGIEFTKPPLPLATDTVRVKRLMHLGQVASTIELPIETLRQLNPQYKLDIVPATTKTYTLVLPQRYLSSYVERQDSIFAKDSIYLKEYLNPANLEKQRQTQPATAARKTSYYTVKKGDTLGAIARRYNVTTSQLMRWNSIKNAQKVRIGQKLRIEK